MSVFQGAKNKDGLSVSDSVCDSAALLCLAWARDTRATQVVHNRSPSRKLVVQGPLAHLHSALLHLHLASIHSVLAMDNSKASEMLIARVLTTRDCIIGR